MNQSNTGNQRDTVLFDGVCNLCSASATWIIERDRRARFRFASLQSEVGRSVLAAAHAPTDLPDSLILIDADGVHTRSNAVIRIGRRLGFPWSLAVLMYLLPRPLRDRFYTWIARNRYRWFGRLNACMIPTAEIQERFLSRDDTQTAVSTSAVGAAPSIPAADPPATAQSTGLQEQDSHGALTSIVAMARRFIFAYLFIYIFCFPAGTIPGTLWLATFYESSKQAVVTWIAKVFFNVNISIYPAGSGDTTYNYFEIVVYGVIAAVAAIAWTVARRGAPIGARTRDAMTTYVRYCLATTLLGYGWHKIIPLQMPYPGPDRLLCTLGDASPMGLLWTFIGASTPYQIFAGLGEAVGGVLLLWRRTSLFGALVGGCVMANVVALNFCYDVPVKLFSSHLLLMALFIIAPHTARLAALLWFNLPAQSTNLRPFRSTWARVLRWLVKAGFVVLAAIAPAFANYQSLKVYGSRGEKKTWDGVYRVESFARDGLSKNDVPDADRWVRVGLNSYGVGTIQRADGTSRRQRMAIDETSGTMTIMRAGEPYPIVLQYAAPEADVITLEGLFDGAEIVARLRRKADEQPLLTTRGFHWINEYPFNR
jgi:predicted DCC family thiol-disulfide oxidoreductase YuxK